MAKSKAKAEYESASSGNTDGEYRLISLSVIFADNNQPRKKFGDEDLAELAASIKKDGVLQPIIVRPEGDWYTIVSGERRFRASEIAGKTEIPAIVRNITEDQALEIQIIENLQRKNINPMEESDAFERLVSRGIDTPALIAEKLGVSTRYIYDRLVLQKVILEVQDAVREEKITIGQAKQFARLNTSDQQKLMEYIGNWDEWPVADIREKINEQFNLKLANAPFDVADKSLVKKAGACLKCSKRSGCNLLLFEDVEQHDVCFDRECWDDKVLAGITKKIDELKAEGKEVRLLSNKWITSTENLIGKSEWNYILEDEETETVGIVIEVSEYDRQDLGKVVFLESRKMNDEAQDDDDNDDEPKSSPRKEHIDYQNRFMITSANEVLAAYQKKKKQFPSVNIKNVLKDAIVSHFYSLQTELIDAIVEALQMEKIPDVNDEDELDDKATIIGYIEDKEESELLRLYLLLVIMDKIEAFDRTPEKEEVEEANMLVSALKIDFFKIAAEIRKESPYELIQEMDAEEA